MVKSRGQMIRSSTVTLVHANDIHSCGEPLGSKAQSVAGITGAFQTVDNQ